MLFSSISFLYYFLPPAIGLYFAVPKRFKNAVLLLASLVFYGWGEPRYVLLMGLSVLSGYGFGLLVEKYRQKGIGRMLCGISVSVSLSFLLYFKYANFFIENLGAVAGILKFSKISPLRLALPIGISFYTFQIISYTVDVYRGEAAQKNLIDLSAYIAMFPQLIAGPIVRYHEIADQLRDREHSLSGAAYGIRRFVIGLAKKILIANQLGELCSVFRASGEKSVLFYWMYAVAFCLHIYFDFSGYSDMAIGLGRVFGFRFPENFNYPYISRSATEFWRRWHISLGTFFRDYVYIPLGGNRKHQMFNIAVVWFLTGLWHGASTNFILWGLYFGVLLMIEKTFLLKVLDALPKIVGHLYLIIAVIFGWLIFYFTDMSRMGAAFNAMIGRGGILPADLLTETRLQSSLWIIIAAVILCTPVYKKISEAGHRIARSTKGGFVIVSTVKVVFLLGILFLSFVSLTAEDTYNAFLYSNF